MLHKFQEMEQCATIKMVENIYDANNSQKGISVNQIIFYKIHQYLQF